MLDLFRLSETSNRFLCRGAGQARGHGSPIERRPTVAVRVRGSTSLLGLIWIIAGVVVAWMYDYITIDLLRRLIAAVLAIFLWFLVLLGVDLHLR
jgi:hypothetical protein